MDDLERKVDEHWEHVLSSLDLLFAKVAEVEGSQQKASTRVDMATQIMEQLLKDRQLLAKQLETTGQAVARLTLNLKDKQQQEPVSPTSSESSQENVIPPIRQRGQSSQRVPTNYHRREDTDRFQMRNVVPKMAFPKFEGENPCIWRDKCQDYFKLFDLPASLWSTMASLNMEAKAAKWLHIYKQKHELGDWEVFMKAVEEKFGDNDYREALTQLLELQHTETLEMYITTFEKLQYQLIMHNSGMDELFFITQFIKGLKPEVGSVVQSQIPDTLHRAMLLAKIQQQVLDKGKQKGHKGAEQPKFLYSQGKTESKSQSHAPTLWKERQVRDYKKANGLCFYCGETFDAQHKTICKKRPQPQNQLNALGAE